MSADHTTEIDPILLAASLGACPIGIIVFGSDGRVTYANSHAERAFEAAPEELLGRRYDAPEWGLADNYGADIPGNRSPLLRSIGARRKATKVSVSIRKAIGGRRFLQISAAPVGTRSGVVVVDDVTREVLLREERGLYQRRLESMVEEKTEELGQAYRELKSEYETIRRSVRALDRTEALHRQLVASIDRAYVAVDSRMLITEFNDHFQTLLGAADRSDVLGRPISEFLVSELPPADANNREHRLIWRHRDGDSLVTSGHYSPVLDSKGSTIGAILLLVPNASLRSVTNPATD